MGRAGEDERIPGCLTIDARYSTGFKKQLFNPSPASTCRPCVRRSSGSIVLLMQTDRRSISTLIGLRNSASPHTPVPSLSTGLPNRPQRVWLWTGTLVTTKVSEPKREDGLKCGGGVRRDGTNTTGCSARIGPASCTSPSSILKLNKQNV
ncbi:hypothetical protein EYF80_023743 [Liparis tanakae]|uniref:Uncharacterized protein n=1 Tax=Liparis tanakae TaxID=230148 RepID=A0A4Z2HJN4_9TELE|nr:hypothetical protein EYF80_023743 [Liparis tanakae]